MSINQTLQRGWILATVATAALAAVSCGDSSVSFVSNPPNGTLSVSISDPPSCKTPNGPFKNVYVTVTSVKAHISAAASESAGGWVELAPNLAANPMQMDLFSTPAGACTLAQLGTGVSLPAGSYQQIRLILLANSATSGPATNACASVQGYNCAILSDNSVHRLELSSQASTGLKIPPGQIVGGPIRVTEGQHVDINIDFNACASIVVQGNGQYRLKPTLTAGQVSATGSGISGQVVDIATQNPIVNGKVLVAVEQPDADNVSRIVMQSAADANGNFSFCPLPTGAYDLVISAVDGNGNALGTTVVTGVPGGTTLGKIALSTMTSPGLGPATIEGTVSAASGAHGAAIDAAISALQSVPASSGSRLVTIPALPNSVETVPTVSSPPNTVCPVGTFCAKYSLVVPHSNPRVGSLSGGQLTFTPPATGPANYVVDARAFGQNSGGASICSPSRIFTDKDVNDQTLAVTGATTTTAKLLSFTACQ